MKAAPGLHPRGGRSVVGLLPSSASLAKTKGFRVTPTTFARNMSTVKENRPDLAACLAQIDPAELTAGIRGILALASAFNALRDEESPLSIVLRRLGLLSDAAFLPDGGTANVAALQFLMGCSDDTVRRAVNRTGVRKHEPTGRGSSMYRPGDIALSGVFGEPEPETAERRTGVAPGQKKTPPTRKNRAGGE